MSQMATLQEINISHLGKRKIIFKMPFLGDMLVPWRVYSFVGDFLPLKKPARLPVQVPGTCECEAGWGGPVSWHPQPGEERCTRKRKTRLKNVFFFFGKLHGSFLLFFCSWWLFFFLCMGWGGIFCEFFFFGGVNIGSYPLISETIWGEFSEETNLNFNLAYKVRDTAAAIFSMTLEVLLDSSTSSNRCVMCFVTPPGKLMVGRWHFPLIWSPFRGTC